MAKSSFSQRNFVDLTGDSSSSEDELVAGPAPKSRTVTRRSPSKSAYVMFSLLLHLTCPSLVAAMPYFPDLQGLADRAKNTFIRYDSAPVVANLKRPSPEEEDNAKPARSRPRTNDAVLKNRNLHHKSSMNLLNRPATNCPAPAVNGVKPKPQPRARTRSPTMKYKSSHISVVIPIVSPPRNVVTYTAEDTAPVAPANSRVRITANPDLHVVNNVDQAELPKNFRFIDDYVFVGGTKRIDQDFLTGCDCRDNQGRNVGCEYVQKCSCLEDAGTDKTGRKIGFPYYAEGTYKGCLQGKYLKTRYMIYECSKSCHCVPWCRNKVVQHGRKLPLDIFRTSNGRGWGLRSSQDIMKGQFIDTYRGEVLTEEETDRREEQGATNKDSYLFSLDKFEDVMQDEDMYVVDGEFMGGPTRFINHSCDPNCAIFSVSTSRGDAKVYDLAFFAQEDIPAGTELTFDYLSNEEDPMSTTDAGKVKSLEEKKGKLATRCLCGSDICRRYLWM